MNPNPSQETVTLDNSDKPVYIVNLSTIHGLLKPLKVKDNFAQLYNYQKWWSPPGFTGLINWFKPLYSQFLVSYKHFTLWLEGTLDKYNLGKIKTEAFIGKLEAIFSFLPPEKSAELLKETWNSLVILDESAKNLKHLINQEAVICFVSNTNELHAEKIKHYVDKFIPQGSESIRYFLSFEKGQLKWNGLVEGAVDKLETEGYARKNMVFISSYQSDLDKAKELGIESQSADQFFPKVEQTPDSLNTSPIPISIQAPLTLASSRLASSRSVFTEVSKQTKNSIEEDTSEKTSLLVNR